MIATNVWEAITDAAESLMCRDGGATMHRLREECGAGFDNCYCEYCEMRRSRVAGRVVASLLLLCGLPVRWGEDEVVVRWATTEKVLGVIT